VRLRINLGTKVVSEEEFVQLPNRGWRNREPHQLVRILTAKHFSAPFLPARVNYRVELQPELVNWSVVR
jgi:hypothetical protein